MKKDRCTIIVPVYNSELTIERCIKSIVNQSYDSLEIIIVNDGSTDNSENICRMWCKKDKRIKLFNQANMGVSSARNYGVKKATGKFICFVDSDDTIEKDMVKILYENMINFDCDLSTCNIKIIKHGKAKSSSNDFNNNLLILNKKIDFYNKKNIFRGYLCNKMFKSEILKKIKLYENIHYCEDEILLIDYAELSNKFVYYDIPLYNYYIYDSSASSWNTWNSKKVTILDAKKICIEKLNKYGSEIIKDYYLDYFFALNDISKRYDKSAKNKQKCKILYKDLIRSKNYTFNQKTSIFIKYNLYFIYSLLRPHIMKNKNNRKKVGILTIIDNNNYGNRLQNYAVQTVINKLNFDCETILNNDYSNCRNFYLLRIIKYTLFSKSCYVNKERAKKFKSFDEYIKFNDKRINPFIKYKKYDYVVAGSDQIWNPYIGRLREVDLLSFQEPRSRISFAASFGVDNISASKVKYTSKMLKTFKAISVRESSGKKIVENLTNRNDVVVLVDPTMLLTATEWNKVASKPKILSSNKYILCYFLGELSDKRKKEIEKVALKNNCEIINILDKSSSFYECGPSEFLWLEKNAFLICTDSFHSSVFAIIYNRPFVVFDREENICNMSSRLDTLISKFKLNDRRYNGKNITKENLKHDYTSAYKILEKEKKKSIKFLEKALDIKDSE